MVFQKVVEILTEIIEIDYEEITLETELTIDNGIDTVNIAKLVIECEKKFNITIHDENVHKFKCVSDIVDYIKKILSDI